MVVIGCCNGMFLTCAGRRRISAQAPGSAAPEGLSAQAKASAGRPAQPAGLRRKAPWEAATRGPRPGAQAEMDKASWLVAVLACLLYYNTLDAGFVYDDR